MNLHQCDKKYIFSLLLSYYIKKCTNIAIIVTLGEPVCDKSVKHPHSPTSEYITDSRWCSTPLKVCTPNSVTHVKTYQNLRDFLKHFGVMMFIKSGIHNTFVDILGCKSNDLLILSTFKCDWYQKPHPFCLQCWRRCVAIHFETTAWDRIWCIWQQHQALIKTVNKTDHYIDKLNKDICDMIKQNQS